MRVEDETFHCLEIFSIPPGLAGPLDGTEKEKAGCTRERGVKMITRSTSAGPFPDNTFARLAPISTLEEAAVIAFLLTVMGGPLVWFLLVTPCVVILGSWAHVALYVAATAILALHPLPHLQGSNCAINRSWFAFALYKYFSYRFDC